MAMDTGLKRKLLTLRLGDADYHGLEVLAQEDHCTISNIIRVAIHQYLQSNGVKTN